MFCERIQRDTFWSWLLLGLGLGQKSWKSRLSDPVSNTIQILWTPCLKVSKSGKHILKFSFEPKTERKYFCISALAL